MVIVHYIVYKSARISKIRCPRNLINAKHWKSNKRLSTIVSFKIIFDILCVVYVANMNIKSYYVDIMVLLARNTPTFQKDKNAVKHNKKKIKISTPNYFYMANLKILSTYLQ